MVNSSYIFDSPKEVLKQLKIHRNIIKKEINNLPYSMHGLRSHLRTHLGLVELNIQEYEDFFKEQKNKKDYDQMQLF